jgi:hypothetical protein
MLDLVLKGEADMVVGSRLLSKSSYMKLINRAGNWLFLASLNVVFGARLSDILSGYRVMTREFVRSVPVFSEGFQIETELTIQALHHRMRIVEVPVTLRKRPDGGESKIRILSDGVKISWMILDLFRTYKPLTFFGSIGLMLIAIGIILGFGIVREFLETGLVPRFPTAIRATGLVLSGLLAISVGLILNTLTRSFKEIYYQIMSIDRRLDDKEPSE